MVTNFIWFDFRYIFILFGNSYELCLNMNLLISKILSHFNFIGLIYCVWIVFIISFVWPACLIFSGDCICDIILKPTFLAFSIRLYSCMGVRIGITQGLFFSNCPVLGIIAYICSLIVLFAPKLAWWKFLTEGLAIFRVWSTVSAMSWS